MSRTTSDAELIAIADIPDWWTPSRGGPHPMRTLREALAVELAASGAKASLFRAGGFGQPAIWLDAEAIERLDKLLKAAAEAA